MTYRQPKLFISDESGKYMAEHIPSKTTKWDLIGNSMRRKLFRWLGWNEYWWHVRPFYGPNFQKIYDLDFIRHVEEVHGSKPDNRWERYHYDYVQKIYAREYAWVQAELARGEDAAPNNDILDAHPYAHAYNNFWLNIKIAPEWSTLYHGVPVTEALDIANEDMKSRGLISTSTDEMEINQNDSEI